MSTPPDDTTRRDLLRFGAALALGAPLAACAPDAPPVTPAPAAPPVPPVPPVPAPFPLEEATLASLGEAQAAGRHTARSLAELYLARIAEVDGLLHAVLETNPDALAIADALDAERRDGRVRGPLHGVPVLLKDNIDTADRMMTTAGSLALVGPAAPSDAGLVARLREAGAVILGKTNLSEWANIRSSASSSGWSARGGQCRNPYALDRSPCGSSSGSAAAVAANLAALAVGTETDGSIVCPAAHCGVVGIKPTVGLVSRSGVIPIAHSQDTAGPMARTVADAAALLTVLAGPDPKDPATAEAAAHAVDYAAALGDGDLTGVRIGVPRVGLWGYHAATDQVLERALAALQRAGATIVDPVPIPNLDGYGDAELTVLLCELVADLEVYLATRVGLPVRTLADVIAWNEAHADQELRWFGQELFVKAAATGGLADPGYADALALCKRLAGPEGVGAALQQHQLTALIAPTCGPALPIDLVLGDSWLGSGSSPAAAAGWPSVSVPVGDVGGLPVGALIFGAAWSEPALLRIAHALELSLKARRPPTLAATAEAIPLTGSSR